MLLMRTYTFTTTISPMDDSDLKYNFRKLRRRYWIRRGLWIPEDTTVVFEKIKKTKGDIGKPALLAEYDANNNIIRIIPFLKYVYVQAHTALLHEMAHLYVGVSTNWDGRKGKHGKTFNDEIDRLYALGAFRKLI